MNPQLYQFLKENFTPAGDWRRTEIRAESPRKKGEAMDIEILNEWIKSPEGRFISKLSTHGRSRPSQGGFLFIGGVHGDEPEGVRLAEDLSRWLQKNHSQVNEPWTLIPCLNVDGYAHNSNRNSRGVDLNRNFPTRTWTSVARSERYNPGPAPGSELEVQAVVNCIDLLKPDLILHFHSWDPCIVYTGEPGKKAAEMIARPTPYEVTTDIGHPTPGSLGDYGWWDCGIPVLCVEAQKQSDLATVWPIFQPGFVDLLLSPKARWKEL